MSTETPEIIECPKCGGKGKIYPSTEDIYGNKVRDTNAWAKECSFCDGRGKVRAIIRLICSCCQRFETIYLEWIETDSEDEG